MKSFDFFTCTTCQDLTPTSARSIKDFNLCDTCSNNKTDICPSCECEDKLFDSIYDLELEESVCSECAQDILSESNARHF